MAIDSATRTEQSHASRLLALPAELRERIYEFALTSPRQIQVIAGETRQPALLETCRQIRHEALGMWYFKNEFALMIHDFDATDWAKLCQHHAGYIAGHHGSLLVCFRGNPNWTNLMRSMKTIFEAKVFQGIEHFDDLSDLEKVWASAQHIVNDARGLNLTWEATERLLQHLHLTATAADARWAI